MKPTHDKMTIDRLTKAAGNGSITRRSFMAHALAAGLTVTTATTLWTKSAKAAPQSGGTFRIGQHDGNATDGYDPAQYVSFGDIALAHTYRAYLTMIMPDQSLGGDVATEWSATPDAMEWRFVLNDKATFHSGKKVTATDVIASINYHRGDDNPSAAASLVSGIVDIVDNGDNSITVKLDSPNADLPWIMPDYHLPILPAKADGSIEWESGDGCGPYVLKSFEPGIGAYLERHEGWHGEGGYFDAVEFKIINDPNARQTALITGDVDAVSLLENKTMALLSRNADIIVDNVPSASCITLPMHCNKAPFDNNDVRMALKLAMDRQDIVEKIAFGAATVGNDFHHNAAMPYFPDDIPQREYDPDQAASLWKKAGMEGQTLEISSADSITTGAIDMLVLYAEHAKAAGINIKPIREPNDGYWSEVWLTKPWMMSNWGARPTPDVMYTLTYKAGAAWNETYWDNARFNELLLMGKGELDDTKRAGIYREMGMILRDDGGALIPYFPNYVTGRRKTVQNIGSVAASWAMDSFRAGSRWWFEG